MKRIPFTIAMFCAASLFAQDNYKNYYWIGQYEGTLTALTSWSEDESGYDNPVTVAPDENTQTTQTIYCVFILTLNTIYGMIIVLHILA